MAAVRIGIITRFQVVSVFGGRVILALHLCQLT